MEKIKNKKIIASFELSLIFLSIFAFSYIISDTNEVFGDKSIEIENEISLISKIKTIGKIISNKLREPIIPTVSAATAEQAGCCQLTYDGKICATSLESECEETFIPGQFCDSVPYCDEGCCYEESTGSYIPGSLESVCSNGIWTTNPNCNIPEARVGCCIIGTNTITSITREACEIESNDRGLDSIDWRLGMDDGTCILIARTGDKGACVSPTGACSFGARTECESSSTFWKNLLCTAPILEANCHMTEETICENNKAYFVDNCGNLANIYDSGKITSIPYWTDIVEPEVSCGADDSDGNEGSTSCGNCDIVKGGICGSASEDDFAVDYGDNYCRTTSCLFDTNGDGIKESIKSGESWCVYDGKIGDGQDVVGSSHWLYECQQGEVLSDRCGDEYRNEICISVTDVDIEDINIDFGIASCVDNYWKECLNINLEEDEDEMIAECTSTPTCRIQSVDISDPYFKFDVCVPKYPAGFDVKYPVQAINEGNCEIASMTCTVPRESEFGSGCTWTDDDEGNENINEGCTTKEFTEQMNEFCMSLGDCGLSVNIAGEPSSNSYNVKYDLSDMSDGAISESRLKARTYPLTSASLTNIMKMHIPIPGQVADSEDYTELAGALGYLDPDIEIDSGEGPDSSGGDLAYNITMYSMGGAAAIGYALLGLGAGVEFGLPEVASQLNTIAPVLGPVLGGAMGALAGAAAGMFVANMLGSSSGATFMIVAGLGVAGATIGFVAPIVAGGAAVPVAGWIVAGIALAVALAGVIISLVEDDCEPIEIHFECKPWKQPPGGDDCHLCNEDPLKPCNEYRCHSLGAACIIVNEDEVDASCEAVPDDPFPPFITRGEIFGDASYTDFGENYATATPLSGGCFEAYDTVTLGINLSKLAYCKYDTKEKAFDDMDYDFGSNSYLMQQYQLLQLPDPSYGESRGLDWSDGMNLFIKCEEIYEKITPEFFRIDLCINQGPDTRAPLIESTIPEDESLTGFDTEEEKITLFTNEPATCRWSSSNVGYDFMENNMTCTSDYAPYSSPYMCMTTLPTPEAENNYYINCMDQPWLDDESERNSKFQSEPYTLKKPSEKIKIDWIEPDNDFEIGTPRATFDLEIKTSAGGIYHKCEYSLSGYEKMFDIIDISGNTHTVPLDLIPGKKNIYVECKDETGDSAQGEIEFTITYDNVVPQISRVWQDGGQLHIITSEEATCEYSTETCRFDWETGAIMNSGHEQFEYVTNVIKGETYYIKCKDEFENDPPMGCSIQIMAT